MMNAVLNSNPPLRVAKSYGKEDKILEDNVYITDG